MSLPHISPAKAKELIDRGAVLVDIRELDEHARNRIPAARHAPLSRLDKLEVGTNVPAVIFHCRSGNRTASNAGRLAQCTDYDAFILDGGIDAWKSAGLPVVENKRPADRDHATGSDRCRLAGFHRHRARHTRPPGFLCTCRLRRRRPDLRRHQRLLHDGALLSFAPWNRHAATAAIA